MKSVISALALAAALATSTLAVAAEKTVTLKVSGMTCASCPYIVRQSLEFVDGVTKAEVSMETGNAVVTFDDARAKVEDLTAATAAVGFPSEPSAENSGS